MCLGVMRPLLSALLSAVVVLASCESENSFESHAESIPFAGSPRGYGIEFPELIKIYFTGLIQLWNGRIDVANEQFDNGRSVFIPIDNLAVTLSKAQNFDVKVATYFREEVNPVTSSPLLQRHPQLPLYSTPRVLVLNTSHPNLSSTFKEMIRVPGNFRVRLGDVSSCDGAYVPFAEFGFSTLPWSEPGTIKLLNITPSATSFPDWPRTLDLNFSASIALRDIRQMRYEVTSLENPKDVQIYPFDRLFDFFWSRPSLVAERRLLAKAVAPTPETPCLSFCEENPMSEACHACCTGVLHEKPWNCGEDSQVKCCTDWTPDCWDTPSERNLLHSCNLCQSFSVRSYQFPGWMTIQDNVLTIDHESLSYDFDYLSLRKVLLRSNVEVKLVIGRGAIVDGFAQAQLAAPASRKFRVVRPVKQAKLSNTLAGRAVRKLPEWINLTIPAPATWRCTTDVRGFGIRHPDLAGGQVMRPGDLCRMRVAVDDPPPYGWQPSTFSPTQAPTTAYPTEAPTTSPTRHPTAAPTAPTTSEPTANPTTPAPTTSPTTRAPTQAPSTPQPTTAFPTTANPTAAPSVSPTVALYAPRDLECENDDYWPQECPFPQYLRLVVDQNNATTLAVDTTDEMFKQDFPDLDRVRGQVSVTVDPASLVTTDGTSTPIETPSEDPFFVIAPLNSDGLGVALTKGGLTINVGRNTVIIPAGTISDTAVVNASIVTPQLPDNIPAPISDVIRIIVYNDNDTVAEIQDLQVPVQMILPIPEIVQEVTKKWSPCQKQVYYHDATCVWWSEANNDWSTGGCTTDNRNSSETTCFCNHLTDFAVLQALESCQEVNPLPYQVFAGPFFCIFLYCLWALGMLAWYKRDSKKPGFGPLAGQHVLMAIAAMARALGPLAVLPGATAGTASALFAIPYLAKFPSFLLLVFQWATIVHFTMQTGGGRRYMMPAFGVFCVLIDLTVAALFIYFHVTEEVAAVLAGTITLAVLAFLYSIAFLGYAFSLARQFPKEASNNSKSGGSTTGKSKRAGLRFRVQAGGACFAILFMLEAACHPAALYLQQQNVQYGLLGATSVFLLAEFLSFCVILWLFYPALSSFFMPRMTTTEVELERNNSTRKSAATVSTAANSEA